MKLRCNAVFYKESLHHVQHTPELFASDLACSCNKRIKKNSNDDKEHYIIRNCSVSITTRSSATAEIVRVGGHYAVQII